MPTYHHILSGMSGSRLRPGFRLGPYWVESHIEIGAMHDVWRGTRDQGGRVAIKALKRKHLMNEDARSAFWDEIALGRALVHPSLIRSQTGFSVGDDLFHVQDLAQGTELQLLFNALRRQRRRLPTLTLLRIALDVTEALQFGHRIRNGFGMPLGLCHGQLCPRNVVVMPDGHAQVLKFGVHTARRNFQQAPREDERYRAPYRAPELCSEEVRPDQRVDLYSLGALLLQLFWHHKGAGLHLEPGPTPHNLALLREPEAPGLAPGFHGLVRAMLDLRPENRPALAEVKATLHSSDPTIVSLQRARLGQTGFPSLNLPTVDFLD